eukprot:m51a1_g9953 hypothetical protein (170) ;mRNA; f:38188-42407
MEKDCATEMRASGIPTVNMQLASKACGPDRAGRMGSNDVMLDAEWQQQETRGTIRLPEVVCGTADVYVSTQSPSVLALNPRKSHLVSEVYDEPTGYVLWKSGQGPSSDPEINAVVDGIAIAGLWKGLCNQKIDDPAMQCDAIMDVVFRTDIAEQPHNSSFIQRLRKTNT